MKIIVTVSGSIAMTDHLIDLNKNHIIKKTMTKDPIRAIPIPATIDAWMKSLLDVVNFVVPLLGPACS